MNIARRAASLVAALSLSLSLSSAAPAVAVVSSALSASDCSPADVAASNGSTARGGVADKDGFVRELNTGQVATDLPARAKGKAPASFSATVDVYFHVITDGDLGYLSEADIRVQMRVMNFDFAGHEGGDDTGFSFELAGITYTDNARWFKMAGFGVETAMKKALKQGGDNALNVYTNTAGAYLGWAYYPSITDSNQSYLDGIVLFASIGLMAANWFILLWTGIALAAVRLVVIPKEEANLIAIFGDEYRGYRTETAALFPFPSRRP